MDLTAEGMAAYDCNDGQSQAAHYRRPRLWIFGGTATVRAFVRSLHRLPHPASDTPFRHIYPP